MVGPNTPWEYLRLWSGQELGGHRVHLIPSHKVRLDWLGSQFPHATLHEDSTRHALIVHSPDQEDTSLDCEIIDFLGSVGWEPFGVFEGAIHFKRQGVARPLEPPRHRPAESLPPQL